MWSYTANGAFDSLNVGDVVSDTFQVLSADNTSTSVTVNILGTNDAAVLSSASVNLDETNAVLSTSGQLTISDVDSAASFVAQAGTAGSYGTFAIGADGVWSYTANGAFDSLNVGDVVSDTFQVLSADNTSTSVTVNILGTNDAAVLSSASVNLDETNAALSTSGQLTISDVDSAASFVAQAGTAGSYGTFAIGADGVWSYTANGAFDSLNVGDVVSDTFQVLSADNTSTSVTVTIHGTNDAPTVSAITLPAVTMNSGAQSITQAELLKENAASDIDEQHSHCDRPLQISNGGGTLLDNHDGTWSYTPALNDDTSVTFSFSVTDGIALVAAVAAMNIADPNDDDSLATGNAIAVDGTNVYGTAGDDTYVSTVGSQTIYAGAGNDTIEAGNGSDSI